MEEGFILRLMIGGLVVLVGGFFALRGLVNWYYRINERTELQQETNKLLKELIQKIDQKK